MANVLTVSSAITAGGASIANAEFVNVAQNGGNGSVVTGSGLMVSLNSATAAAGNIAVSQAAASLASFNFTAANDGVVTVNTLKLKKTGLSADSSLSNIYLYDGNNKLTDGGSFSNGVVTFSNNSGLFTVAAGTTKTITVKTDASSDSNVATGNIGVSIDSASSVVSTGASVTGAFPLSGNLMSFVNVTDLASVSLGANSASGGNVNAGSMNYTVFSESVSVSQRSVKLGYVAFKQVGSVNNDDVQNFKLYVNGVQAGSTASLTSDNRVIFDLTSAPVSLTTGPTSLEVRADIVKGSSRNFSLQIQTASDIILSDSNYGINVAVSSASAGLGSSVVFNVQTGNVSLTLDPNFTTDQVVKNSANVTLAKFTAKAYGEDMKFNNVIAKLTFGLAGTSANTEGINNLAIYVNGVQVGSSQNYVRSNNVFPTAGGYVGDANVGYASFGTNNLFTLTAGQTATIEIKGDINMLSNSAVTTITSDLIVAANKVQGNTSYATWPTPNANTYSGKLLTVVSGGLGVSTNTGFQDQTVSYNAPAQKVGSYIINASNAEAVRVTNLQVGLTMGGGGDINQVSNVVVKYDSVSTPGQASAVTMNYPVDFTIPANQSKVIDVYADLGSLANNNTITTSLKVTATGVNTSTSVGNDNAQTGQKITIGVGTMLAANVSLVSNQPTAQLIAGGTSNLVAATYKMTADSGTTKVTDLVFKVYNDAHAAANTTAVQSLDLRVNGTVLANAPVVGAAATVTFSGLSIDVPNTVNGAQVEVLPHFNNVTAANQGGAATNNAVMLGMDSFKYLAGNTSATVDLSGAPVYSNEHVLVAGYPTLALASDNPTGQTSGYAGGNTDMLKFTVTNSGSNTMYVRQIVLNSAHTAGATIAANGVKVYNAGDTSTALNAAGTTIGNSGANFGVKFDNDFTINAGQSATFLVRVDVTSMATTGDSVRIDLGSADAAYAAAVANAGAIVANTWGWNDGTIAGYMNGFLFKNLPASGKPFVK